MRPGVRSRTFTKRTHTKVAEQKQPSLQVARNSLCPTTGRERNRSKSWQRDYKAFKSVQNLAERDLINQSARISWNDKQPKERRET